MFGFFMLFENLEIYSSQLITQQHEDTRDCNNRIGESSALRLEPLGVGRWRSMLQTLLKCCSSGYKIKWNYTMKIARDSFLYQNYGHIMIEAIKRNFQKKSNFPRKNLEIKKQCFTCLIKLSGCRRPRHP